MAEASRSAYAQLLGAWTPAAGAVGRLELLAPLTPRLSAFAGAQWSTRDGPRAEGGVRFRF